MTSLPSSDSVLGLAALSPDDVWAVGSTSSADGEQTLTLTLNWSGETWATVPSPDPAGSSTSVLIGAAAIGPDSVFAVGQGGGATGNGTLSLISDNG